MGPRKLNLEQYARRDFRVKCYACRRWMRHAPTEKSPHQRRAGLLSFVCMRCAVLFPPEAPDEPAAGSDSHSHA
jgi:hypothetical protein